MKKMKVAKNILKVAAMAVTTVGDSNTMGIGSCAIESAKSYLKKECKSELLATLAHATIDFSETLATYDAEMKYSRYELQRRNMKHLVLLSAHYAAMAVLYMRREGVKENGFPDYVDLFKATILKIENQNLADFLTRMI